MATVPTAPDPTRLLGRLSDDDRLSKADLIEVIAHCAATRASADYRMLQAIGQMHDEHEEDYACEVAGDSTHEHTDAASLLELAEHVAAGRDPRARFGPDGLDRTIADVGAVLTVTPARARELIESAHAARYRLRFTGHALACGRIDLQRFLIAVRRTDLCDEDAIRDVDAHLAEALFARDQMSVSRFITLVDSIIARLDPAATRRRRELAEADRDIRIRPDRFAPGQARISGSLPVESGAAVDARLRAMADAVHPTDPRNRAQRRADALLALANGENALRCRCAECAASADTPSTSPDAAPTGPRPTFHIVANLSSLLGLDDAPGHLDGHGIIDADTMRSLLADARRSIIRPDHEAAARSAMRYAPTPKIRSLVCAGEISCTFPGCDRAVRDCDIDHTTPFDHDDPRRGGPTLRHNLKPLCRFHHRIKTFGRWRDMTDALGAITFESPTGHRFVGNAYSARELFPTLISTQPPEHPARLRIERDARHRRERIDDERAAWTANNPPPF